MIVDAHPALSLLDDCPWFCHLVGSRYVGVYDRDKSDYDFLVVCDEDWYSGLRPWLTEKGFKPQGDGYYGPDDNILGTHVWTWKDPERKLPSVDVMPVTSAEAKFRLRFFKAMKKVGDSRGGLLAKALKEGKVWANLWDCVREMEGK